MTTAGVHYSSSEREFRKWFRDDDDCLDWLRGNVQRICTQCGNISPPKVVTAGYGLRIIVASSTFIALC